MGEKGRLTAMAATFIAMSVFCWGTSVWSAGQAGGSASETRAETQTVREEVNALSVAAQGTLKPVSETSAADSSRASDTSKTPDDTGKPDDPEILSGINGSQTAQRALSEEETEALATAFAGAGTPFFETVAELSVQQLEEAAIWYLMERGEMPQPHGGETVLPAQTLCGTAAELFGADIEQPESCAYAEFDRERDAFIMTAAAVAPVYAAAADGQDAVGGEVRHTKALYSPDGWEGDVLGNRYRPEPAARGILVMREGKVIAWREG